MEEVDEMIDELRKFSSGVAELSQPVSQFLVVAFENNINMRLPDDYKYTISQINGFSIMGDEVYGIKGDGVPQSLETVHRREHIDISYPQPPYLVPFSPDGGGNFYCFDTRYRTKEGRSCPVVFWTSNYEYNDEDLPEVTNESFVDFVNEVIIGWTLEKYNYDGTEK